MIFFIKEKAHTSNYRVKMLHNIFISTPSLTEVLQSDTVWCNVNDSGGNFIELLTNVGILILCNPIAALCTEKYFPVITKTFCIFSVITHKPPRNKTMRNVEIEFSSVDLADDKISIACCLLSVLLHKFQLCIIFM